MTQSSLKKIYVRLTIYPLVLLLITVILCSTVEKLHSKLLDIGGSQWSSYSELRQPAVKPDCDLNANVATHAEPGENDELLDDLFGEKEESVSEEAVAAAKAVCQEKFDKYNEILNKQNDASLKRFVNFETTIGNLATKSVGFGKHFLILVFIFCGAAVTLQRQHLGLRSPKTKSEDRVSQIVQFFGNIIVMFSFLAYYLQDLKSGVEQVSNLPIFWMIGFGVMALCNIILIIRPLAPPADADVKSE